MQPTQDFNERNLLWMRGRKFKMTYRSTAKMSKEEWTSLAKGTEEEIAKGIFKFKGIYAASAGGKKVLSTNNAVDALVLRKINDNIRRAYGIRQAQRSHAIKLARKALSEWTPKGIVSLDLKSCFESITPGDVITRLKVDGRVSHQTIHLLETFFRQTKSFGSNRYSKGLPRGVLISSTLAELFLKDLDRKVSTLSGLYVYIRYVDDILAIAAKPPEVLHEEITSHATSMGLKINTTKSFMRQAGCVCGFSCTHDTGKCPCPDGKCICELPKGNLESIDYLGYKLIFATGRLAQKKPACYALIATRKVKKIKTRAAQAISAYRKRADYSLLRDRLRYLTRNITIDKSLKSSRLLSGIAFTYDQYSAPPGQHPFQTVTIEHLDKFLRTKLRRLLSKSTLPKNLKQALLINSFVAGHSKRHRVTFAAPRIKAIRNCWHG